MSAIINALIGGNPENATNHLLDNFKTSNSMSGYDLNYSMLYGSVDWTYYSDSCPVTLLHYLAMCSVLSEEYFNILKSGVQNGQISSLNSSVDKNGKCVDQYVLALSFVNPNFKSSCNKILSWLYTNGLSQQSDTNGVSVCKKNQQSGGSFNKNEFIAKYNSNTLIGGGKSVTGMRQMHFKEDTSMMAATDESDYDGGKFSNDHENAINIIASKLNLKSSDIKVRAIKSLLYDKVKADFPTLLGKDRTAKLEEYAASMISSLSDSAINTRIKLISDIDATKLSKTGSDSDKKPPKKESSKKTEKKSSVKKTKSKK